MAHVLGLLALAFLVAACGPTSVPLEELAARQQAFLGQRVATSGTVTRIVDPDGAAYYVLEDERRDRVLLEPAELVAAHADERVVVTGRFAVSPTKGRVIRVESIAPAGSSP